MARQQPKLGRRRGDVPRKPLSVDGGDDQRPAAEAEALFNNLVGNLVRTPHKPHQDERPRREKR